MKEKTRKEGGGSCQTSFWSPEERQQAAGGMLAKRGGEVEVDKTKRRERGTDRQTGRQRDRRSDRQENRVTDRQRGRQTEIDRWMERVRGEKASERESNRKRERELLISRGVSAAGSLPQL